MTRSLLPGRRGSRPFRTPGTPGFRDALFESLESRVLLTIIINPVFGPLTEKQDGDGKLHNPIINVVFWGSFWGSTDSPDALAIQDAITKVVTSTFPAIVHQYGADGSDMFLNDVAFNGSNPSSGDFDAGDIDDIIQDKVGNPFPEPDNGHGHDFIYLVVTPPNTDSSEGEHVAGFNFEADHGILDRDHYPCIWAGTGHNADGTVNIDQFSWTFSHEVAEVMTDFGNNGYEINTPPAWQGGGDDQIGDKEPNAYRFRMSNGVMVQPIWSKSINKIEVIDGTVQDLILDPIWNGTSFTQAFTVTINADQLAPFDNADNFSVGPGFNGGLKLTLNGEEYFFDAGKIHELDLHMGTGFNTVDLSGLPASVRVKMDADPSLGQIELTGPDVLTSWNLTNINSGTFNNGISTFADVNSITGGTGGNIFNMFPSGRLSGVLDGGIARVGTSNNLTYTNFGGPAAVDLATNFATGIGLAIPGHFNTIRNIHHFLGSPGGGDTIIGSGGDWDIFTSSIVTGNADFRNFENLVGGTGDDDFRFNVGGAVAGNIDGLGGNNTLDYRPLPGPITVNFSTNTASFVGGTFANITNVLGSQSPNDIIIGPDAAWLISGPDAGSVNGITFASIENLQGSGDTDVFTFQPGGSISGNLDGGLGSNTLDFSQVTTPVAIDFVHHTATGIGGTFSNIGTFTGGPQTSIVGPDAPTTYTINGHNAFSAFGITFTGIPAITGGSFNDTFLILPGGRLDGAINGGGGTNTLSYAQFTAEVVVNLTRGTGTGLGGVSHIQNLIGGLANSLLVGDASDNILTGGAGRNLLIGAIGADTIAAGGGDSILIADSTLYDANAGALAALFAEWTRTDLSFQQRVSDLLSTSGNGLNLSYTLDKAAILIDNSADLLIGADPGYDWFIESKKTDSLTGDNSGDHITQI